jgi:DNA polymerase-3 subunit epsilon
LNFVAIDFETANRSADSACSVGLVRVEEGRVVDSLCLLLRPPEDFFEFTHIHGLSWEDVHDSPSFGEAFGQISSFTAGASFLAAHNAPFDRGVLEACCTRHGIWLPKLQWVDTVRVARDVFKIFPTKLSNVSAALNIPLNHHEALSDASACAQILLKASQVGWRWLPAAR